MTRVLSIHLVAIIQRPILMVSGAISLILQLKKVSLFAYNSTFIDINLDFILLYTQSFERGCFLVA